MRVWRIAARAHAAFDGMGARLYGSRWTPKGRAAVFASATLSLAVLERFVHADPDLGSVPLVAISVDIAEAIAVESVAVADLPADWRAYPPPPPLASIGDRWLAAAASPVLSVPSAIIPHERNVVLNPAHPEFGRLAIGRPEPFAFDPRMWKAGG